MARWAKALLAGVAIGLVAAGFVVSPAGSSFEERLGLPWLFSLRGPIPPPDDVVIVAIDRRSADALGFAPEPRDWPRSIHARLVDRLTAAGATVIAFDLSFERARSVDEDTAFAEAIARSGRVVLFQAMERSRRPVHDPSLDQTRWIWLEEVRRPLSVFADQAVAIAPFPLPRVPARVSQYWTFLPANRMPTLPVMALHVQARPLLDRWSELLERSGAPTVGRIGEDAEFSHLGRFGERARGFRLAFAGDSKLVDKIRRTVAADEAAGARTAMTASEWTLIERLIHLYDGPGSRYLNFYGPPGTIRTLAYASVIADEVDVQANVAGRCVFVGYSELMVPTKVDSFQTVYSRADGVDLSGVEIAATAFGNLVGGRALVPAPGAVRVGLVLALGVLLSLAAFLLPAALAIPAALALVAGYVVAAYLAFSNADLWLPVATPVLVQLPVALFAGLVWQYAGARRGRLRAQHALSQFVPATVAHHLSDHPLAPIELKDTVYATCLATDAENFTPLTESLAPGAAAAYLNAYFAALSQPVQDHGADFREFHADGMLAAWMASQPDRASREQACLAALAAVGAIEAFNARPSSLRLGVRIGLHTGEVFIGTIGAGGRVGFQLVGDIVNTASRIEGLNKYLGTRLLASEAVVADLDSFLLRPAGHFRLKGKLAAIPIVEIISTIEDASDGQRMCVERFTDALARLQAGQIGQAVVAFSRLLEMNPQDGPTRFYLDHCRARLATADGGGDSAVINLDRK